MTVNEADLRAAGGERSPLLGQARRTRVEGDESSSSTLTRGDEEEIEDVDKANQQVGRGRGLLIILSLWGLIFLQAANMSGITTTQSKIAEDLDAFASASWFTSAYLISASSMSPLTARLAQVFSPRYYMFVSSLFFAIGGLVASVAGTLGIFLLGRAIQGIGGAGIMVVSFILVLELAGKKRRGLFIGLVNTGFTTGVSFGAVIAGALLPVTGWRFLFSIQAPLALLFGLGLLFSIPSSFTSGHTTMPSSILTKLREIDYLGAVTLTLTLLLFLFGLSFPKVLLLPIITSLILFPLFVYIELYWASDPIIPLSVLKNRGALLSCLAQLGLMASRWMVLFYAPTYAIALRSWSPASAGSILIPTNLGFALGGIIVGLTHIKRAGSFWLPCIVSYILFSASLLVLSQISTETVPAGVFVVVVFCNGLFTGAALNYTLAHLLHLTPASTHFISTSLLATFRGFAGSFGSAIGGGLFVRTLKSSLETGFEDNGGLEGREELVRKLLGSPALVKGLKGMEAVVAKTAYATALGRLFLCGAGVALMVTGVQAATGWRKGEEGKIVEDEGLLGSGRATPAVAEEEEDWEEGLEQGV